MSFINSIFLFAIAAAVLPVLFHLVRRMRAKTIPFSSLMFLKATPKELIRKRRLKDRLLMAARALLLALLALVFARPYIPSDQLPFVSGRESESVVVVVDRSFSMRHDGAFERAVAAARDRLSSAAADDEVALVAFDEEVQVLTALASDRSAADAALGRLEVGFGATDFFPALQRAEDLLQDARHPRRVVVLVSDFQEGGWTGALDNWKLRPGVAFDPVAVGGSDVGNAFVEAFELSTRPGDQGESVRFDARIAATGRLAERSRRAALMLGGGEVDARILPARPSVPVSFQRYITEEGFFQGSIRVDGDDLADDNTYYFTDRMKGLPRVLVVDTPASSTRREAFYLRSAFDLGDASRFRFSTSDRLTIGALNEADVVFLSRIPDSAERTALRRYVEAGGAVVISPGESSDSDALAGMLESLGMGRMDRIVDAREELGYQAIIGEVDTRHPIFEPFDGGGRAAIFRPRFRRYARLEPSEETDVIGRFDSGDPFMLERTLGGGRVIFLASTLNTAWTDLPIDETFVPLVYQIARYATRADDEKNTFYVGESVPLVGAPSESVEVRAPEGRLFRVQMDGEGRGYFRETAVPGHYAAAPQSGTRFFSVNVRPSESDLSRRDAEEVYAAVMPATDAPATPQEAAAAVVDDDEQRQKLWRVLLAVVLALFLIESYAANRRARKREPAAPPGQRSRVRSSV